MPLPIANPIGTQQPTTAMPQVITRRVMAVDDDEFFREMLSRELAEFGIAVEAFADAPSFLGAIGRAEDADLILLDWSLADSCGLDLLPQIRRRGITIPVVILTGRALAANESLAFDCGATDFIDKARGISILIRRLNNIAMAKLPAPIVSEQVIEVGDLSLKVKVSRAHWKGEDVDLTVGEFKVVHLLAARAGQHITYREIYDTMHYQGFLAGYGADGFHNNVRSSIKRIRQKFRGLDPSFSAIENFTSFGYAWRAGGGAS